MKNEVQKFQTKWKEFLSGLQWPVHVLKVLILQLTFAKSWVEWKRTRFMTKKSILYPPLGGMAPSFWHGFLKGKRGACMLRWGPSPSAGTPLWPPSTSWAGGKSSFCWKEFCKFFSFFCPVFCLFFPSNFPLVLPPHKKTLPIDHWNKHIE